MAHEIETHGDQAAAVFAREDAWHRLGTTLPDAFTAEDAMTLGHLGGWDVRKATLTAPTGAGSVKVPGHFATLRTNPFTGKTEALGVVGSAYHPIQNEEHCEFLDALTHESGAGFESAGSLRGGREVFLTMRLPETIRVGGVDPVGLYVAALNSHDGTSAFRLLVTPVRIVCANTQRAALANHQQSWSIRHTRNAKAAVQAAREGLKLTVEYCAEFEAEAERMINQTLTDGQFADIIAREVGPQDDMGTRAAANAAAEVEALMRLWHSDTQDTIRGTAWSGYQCFTEYVDHEIGVRAPAGRDEREYRAERVLTDPQLGGIKAAAFDLFRVPA